MNYFAHGWRFTDRPYFLVGTAVPDLLSVADRSVRMRMRRVQPCADGSGSTLDQVAQGVLQHLKDDGWFHRTVAFHEVSGELTALLRTLNLPDPNFRPSFLGHILLEMLLDAALIARDPPGLERYYAALAEVDPAMLQECVNQMAKTPTERIAPLFPHFLKEGFLWDYLDSERLLRRLNQVMNRLRLAFLPPETIDLLEQARMVVSRRADELLTEPAEFPSEP